MKIQKNPELVISIVGCDVGNISHLFGQQGNYLSGKVRLDAARGRREDAT